MCFSFASSFLSTCRVLPMSTETDGNATDCLPTPPTSPQRAQQIFQQMMNSPPLMPGSNVDATAKIPSPIALGSLLASVKLASESNQASTPAMTSTPTPKDCALPSPTGALFASPPSSKNRPPLAQSLSAKRARQVPGTLDLSSLPQFPQHPLSSLHLTPHGSELSGSTPRAVPERPGLFSRWSSDSERTSSCTSSSCESCDEEETYEEVGESAFDDAEHDAADEADAEHVGNEGGVAARPSVGKRSVTMKRSISGPNPFFLSPSVAYDPIASPLPVSSPSILSSLLPPAPKPHQHGFSPYAEEQGFTFAGPSASVSSPLAQISPSSPSSSSQARRKKRSHHHKHRQGKQGQSDDGFHDSSDSSMGSSRSGGSPSGPAPRLTRSQGLRIKDQGDRPRGRYARALSQQLKHGSSTPSSPMKTATALLGGTISPAESTTDPLRVKLREMPGAKTPDGSAPPSPSPSPTSRQSYNHPSASPRQHQQHLRPTFARSLSSPKLRAASPLHLSSFPGEGGNSNAKDTKRDVFNSAFSFANRESPARSPLALKSPRTSMTTIKENEQDSNPYFAGYA